MTRPQTRGRHRQTVRGRSKGAHEIRDRISRRVLVEQAGTKTRFVLEPHPCCRRHDHPGGQRKVAVAMTWPAWSIRRACCCPSIPPGSGAAQMPLPCTKSNRPSVSTAPRPVTNWQRTDPDIATPRRLTLTHSGWPPAANVPTGTPFSRKTPTSLSGRAAGWERPVTSRTVPASSRQTATAAPVALVTALVRRRGLTRSSTARSKPRGGSVPGTIYNRRIATSLNSATSSPQSRHPNR